MTAAICARNLLLFLPLVLGVLSVGCAGERVAEDVAVMFAARRVGDSRDAGLYKRATMTIRAGEWDHVATIHGMADDMDLCDTIIDALKVRAPQDDYRCRLLN